MKCFLAFIQPVFEETQIASGFRIFEFRVDQVEMGGPK